jgi:hypothetical protein
VIAVIDVAALFAHAAQLRDRAAAGEALGLVDTIDADSPLCGLIWPLADVLEACGRSTREALAVASQFVGQLTPESGKPLH